MTAFPLPGTAPATVAAPAPGTGPGYWAGAPSALQDADGSFVIAYRVRHGHDGVDETVIARSADGATLETVAVLDETRFGAAGMERPALVPADGGWRLYYCCAAPAPSKHWWIGMVEAPTLEALATAEGRTVLAGDAVTALKDPIVRRTHTGYEAWLCAHNLDQPGHEDRMSSLYATSDDGLDWTLHGTVLRGRPGTWDARGARITTILRDGRAAYDGRASAEENWFERTGLTDLSGRRLTDEPVADVRYLEAVALDWGGQYRIYYEARREDGSHELRTELIA